jgi:hypothetical protein
MKQPAAWPNEGCSLLWSGVVWASWNRSCSRAGSEDRAEEHGAKQLRASRNSTNNRRKLSGSQPSWGLAQGTEKKTATRREKIGQEDQENGCPWANQGVTRTHPCSSATAVPAVFQRPGWHKGAVSLEPKLYAKIANGIIVAGLRSSVTRCWWCDATCRARNGRLERSEEARR